MKKIFIGFLISLCVPFVSFAAYDDVTLETSAILDVGGYELTVYSTSAVIESITVGASNFSVNLVNGSAFIVSSADSVAFTHDANDVYVTSEFCDDTESRLGLASVSGSVTITVTPSGTCSVAVEAPGRTASGSRLQKSVSTAPVVVINQSQTALLETLRALIAQFIALGGTPSPEMLALVGTTSSAGAYTRDLDIGATGDDVNTLQKFLIAQNKGPKASALGANGATHLFGPLTQAALAEYQASIGLTPAVGYFGPKTRAYVQSLGQ